MVKMQYKSSPISEITLESERCSTRLYLPTGLRLCYTMKLEHLHGGILLRCGVCLQGMSKRVFIGSQGRSSGKKLSCWRCYKGASRSTCVVGWLGLGVNRARYLRFFFLSAIWRLIPTVDLTRLPAKWGQLASHPAEPTW
jgi:hypothetical protein